MSNNIASKGPYKYDDDEDYVPTKKVKYSFRDDGSIKEKKHTLDSDEEDEDNKEMKKKQEELTNDEIDGQEDATIDFEGETKITPFNMNEEMEEGHFDRDGFYHFNKESEMLKDAWLEDIDWVKVKRQGEDIAKYGSDAESDSDDEDLLPKGTDLREQKKEEISIYAEIHRLLKPDETIAKALKRLGGKTKKLSTAERWKLKKQGKLGEALDGNMADFNKLTELANRIIQSGNMDVYDETYEMVQLKIRRFEASQKGVQEPVMDMFSDDTSSSNKKPDSPVDDPSQKDTFDEVKWEYRLTNDEEAQVHGPFATDKMIAWKDSNFFKDGAFVRRVSEPPGPWYQVARVDFELYV